MRSDDARADPDADSVDLEAAGSDRSVPPLPASSTPPAPSSGYATSRSRHARVVRLSRSGSINQNAQTFIQRSAAFTAGAARPRHGWCTTILVTRDGDGLHSLAVVPRGTDPSAVLSLAHAVGARVDDVAAVPPLSATVVGRLEAAVDARMGRVTQQGADPAETSRLLGQALRPGCWVAVTLRRPTRAETNAHQRWLEHQSGSLAPTHHSRQPDAVVMSVGCGGASADQVRTILRQVAAVLPGFDVSTTPRVFTRPGAAAGHGVRGLLAAGAAVGLGSTPVADRWASLPDSVLATSPVATTLIEHLPDVAAAAVGGCAAWHLLAAARDASGGWPWWRSSAWGDRWSAAASGRGRTPFPTPPVRQRRPRAPATATTDPVTGVERPARTGDYPLHRASFLVGSQVVAALAAPQAGAVSGADSTDARVMPPVLLSGAGWRIGDIDGDPVSLNMQDLKNGIAVLGDPESGKTKLLEALWAVCCLDRTRPSHRHGFPGRDNTLVAFESKGWPQIEAYRSWADLAGDDLQVIDVGDPASVRIDLFASEGTPKRRSALFMGLMRDGFDDDEIRGRSSEVIGAVLTTALAVLHSPELAEAEVLVPVRAEHPVLRTGLSPVDLAHALSGGFGDGLAKGLFDRVVAVSTARLQADPADVWGVLLAEAAAEQRAFMEGTATTRRNHMQAARNKFGTLMQLDHWWSPGRPATTWEDIVTGHRNVVINFGRSASGWESSDQAEGRIVSAMLLTRLRQVIGARCAGWQAGDRWVSVFTDELALQVGSQPDVLTWLKDDGREFGVRLHCATQRIAQLDRRVAEALLTFETLVSFRQKSSVAAGQTAAELSSAGDEWTAFDVQALAPYHAAIQTMWERRRLPAFVTPVPRFEADRRGWADRWGFDLSLRVAGRSTAEQSNPHTDGVASWEGVDDVRLDVPLAADREPGASGTIDGDVR